MLVGVVLAFGVGFRNIRYPEINGLEAAYLNSSLFVITILRCVASTEIMPYTHAKVINGNSTILAIFQFEVSTTSYYLISFAINVGNDSLDNAAALRTDTESDVYRYLVETYFWHFKPFP